LKRFCIYSFINIPIYNAFQLCRIPALGVNLREVRTHLVTKTSIADQSQAELAQSFPADAANKGILNSYLAGDVLNLPS